MTVLTVERPQDNLVAVQQPPGYKDILLVEALWPLSVERYHAMIQAGIITDDDPIELLEGMLVAKMSKNPPHRAANYLLRRLLEQLIPNTWYVDTQEPITTIDSEPEPDLTVVRGDTLDYLERHPGPQEIALVIEIADATLARDQKLKKRIYARAGIPVYWIVNLVKQQIEVYSQPVTSSRQPDYHQQRVYGLADLVPVVLDGVEIGQLAVKEILPFAE